METVLTAFTLLNDDIIEFGNKIIGNAVDMGASDIHIECFRETAKVRYRIDGILREMDNLSSVLFPQYDAIVARIKIISKLDIAERDNVINLFKNHEFDCVVNLAAQAGVRYSLENPATYIDSNLVGFANIIEGCRKSKISHLIYASSSSVYGLNTKQPFSTHNSVNHPISLYRLDVH